MNKRTIILATAIAGLVLIFGISMLYAWNQINFRSFKIFILIGTLVWFSGILVANQLKKR